MLETCSSAHFTCHWSCMCVKCKVVFMLLNTPYKRQPVHTAWGVLVWLSCHITKRKNKKTLYEQTQPQIASFLLRRRWISSRVDSYVQQVTSHAVKGLPLFFFFLITSQLEEARNAVSSCTRKSQALLLREGVREPRKDMWHSIVRVFNRRRFGIRRIGLDAIIRGLIRASTPDFVDWLSD